MPVVIEWDSRFSVGNSVLDAQHQKLLGLCNSLAHCLAADPQEARFKYHEILHQFIVYAQEHFRIEEKFLERSGYTDLAHHLREHRAFEEKTADWAFAATMNSLDLLEVQRFLAIWWSNHILVSDMQFKPLLESKRS